MSRSENSAPTTALNIVGFALRTIWRVVMQRPVAAVWVELTSGIDTPESHVRMGVAMRCTRLAQAHTMEALTDMVERLAQLDTQPTKKAGPKKEMLH